MPEDKWNFSKCLEYQNTTTTTTAATITTTMTSAAATDTAAITILEKQNHPNISLFQGPMSLHKQKLCRHNFIFVCVPNSIIGYFRFLGQWRY
jgi:hypothetical protein